MIDSAPVRAWANDFARMWQEVREDALAAVERVGRSGRLILGEEVEGFERELADWWGVGHVVGVASGMDALEIALRCAGVGAGDKVLTTPLTAFATTLSIVRAGAMPVWCDVDDSGGLDLDQADAVLRADAAIKALLPVHLYGHPLDPVALRGFAEQHGVVLVEDCAQSAGAVRDGRPTGRAGIAAATSFYPTKNLGALGDGGAVLTDDVQIAERARRLRNYGVDSAGQHAELGLNSRLDELHAAVMRSAQLPRLSAWLARREATSRVYDAALVENATLRPVRPSGGSSAHHLYPVEVISGDPVMVAAALRSHGVAVGRHYPVACPDQPAALGIGERRGDLAVARRLATRELSLPIHPFLHEREIEAVVEACREVAQ